MLRRASSEVSFPFGEQNASRLMLFRLVLLL